MVTNGPEMDAAGYCVNLVQLVMLLNNKMQQSLR